MFSSLFELYLKVSNKQDKKKQNEDSEKKTNKTTLQNLDNMLMLLNEIKDEPCNNSIENIVPANSKILVNNVEDLSINYDFNDIKSYNSDIRSNSLVEDSPSKKIQNQVESLQCLFTWKLKSQKKQDLVTHIKNKYGDYNLDISVPVFTFVRFIGNLIISYELYQKGESDASDIKILEIGNWLEKLDKGTDQFYMSISIALKHIRMANFIYKLYTENETGGLKLLFNEIVSFENMDNKSKAAVHAIRAAILIEYGENPICYKNACKYAKKAFELDSKTSHWFHVYALVLITQREFLRSHTLYAIEKPSLQTNEMCQTKNVIDLAIQKAIISSNDDSISSLDSLVLTVLNQFMTNKFKMELNALSGFQTVNLKDMSEENIVSCFEEDIRFILEKYKNGADVVPFLNLLVSKYNHYYRWKIIAEICSYTILFTNNLRFGVELLLILIEEPEISISDLIIKHHSSFLNQSKVFNLAELIWNEIRITTKCFVEISIEDILFYYKMFFKIKDSCNLKMKTVDPFMRVKLIGDLSAKCKSSNTYQNETRSSYNQSFVDISTNVLKCRIRKLIQMQAETEQYAMPNNVLNYSQKQFNLHNLGTQNTNTCFNRNYTNYNYIEQYQSFKSGPSLLNLKFDVTFQSTIHTSNTTTNITSNLIHIDTSLSILPRGLTSQATYKACLKKILLNHPDGFRIYTDASKIHDNVGIAIVSDKNSYTYKLSSEYTSCDAEAVAILRALDYALVENFNHYIILSDSLSTITCIQNQNISSDVIYSILCLLHAHRLKGNLMHLIWIPSHNAIGGNEKADRLAKQIATSTTAITYSHNSFMTLNLESKLFKM